MKAVAKAALDVAVLTAVVKISSDGTLSWPAAFVTAALTATVIALAVAGFRYARAYSKR